MAKTQTPFLSFTAKGSVGGSITAQKRGPSSLIREKPTPTDPYSLPQAYQRWLYQDYAYLWTKQTETVKAQYRLLGSRHHRTAFQEWMSDKLFNLPDIVGTWHLDEKSGAIAHDSSKNSNHLTIYGASPTDGLISNAFFFDGINDLCSHPSLPPFGQLFSVEFFFKREPLPGPYGNLLNIDGSAWNVIGGFLIFDWNDGYIQARAQNVADGAETGALLESTIHNNEWRHYVLNWSKPTLSTFTNGLAVDSINWNHDIAWSIYQFQLAFWWIYWTKGTIDHLVIRNRTLDLTEIKRHAERRYPP